MGERHDDQHEARRREAAIESVDAIEGVDAVRLAVLSDIGINLPRDWPPFLAVEPSYVGNRDI
jgi:hypothetical protein